MEQVVGLDGCAITCVHADRVRMVREAAPREEGGRSRSVPLPARGDPLSPR